MNDTIDVTFGFDESDLDRFVRAVLLDLDAAGALADYLDERDPPTAPYLSGKPSLSRGELFRRRWKKWRKDRDACFATVYKHARRVFKMTAYEAFDHAKIFVPHVIEDERFRSYIRRKLGVRFATARDFH